MSLFPSRSVGPLPEMMSAPGSSSSWSVCGTVKVECTCSPSTWKLSSRSAPSIPGGSTGSFVEVQAVTSRREAAAPPNTPRHHRVGREEVAVDTPHRLYRSDPAHHGHDLAENGRLITVDRLVGVVAWHQLDMAVLGAA